MSDLKQTAPVPGLKARLKQQLRAHPRLWGAYWQAKQQIRRLALLRYFWYDIRHTYRGMFWRHQHVQVRTLGAEMLFQYHKLEKGLVMPGKRRLFGLEPAHASMQLIQRWRAAGHDLQDPVYVGAVETLRAYQSRLRDNELDPKGIILPQVDVFLRSSGDGDAALATPQKLVKAMVSDLSPAATFRSLTEARRSVRSFLPEAVPHGVFEEAVRLAQLSPSACNRQPCRIYLVNDEERKRQLLALQNGNLGFGHLAPHVAIITADEECFFDASERHEPYIDGGLFSMSFILALRAQHVASCCLNWCVSPETDRRAHALFSLPQSQRIVMLMAIGYAPEECAVPRSPRRGLEQVLISL